MVSGPLVSMVITLLFLTSHLTPSDFMDENLFHKFQYSTEALNAGFDGVIMTEMIPLVISGMGISISTTTSIITITIMALLRSIFLLNNHKIW